MPKFLHKKNDSINSNEFHSQKIQQTSVLYGAMLIGICLGFGVSIINTRLLSTEDFGKFKFIQQLFALMATVFSFGFTYSAGTLIARTKMILHRDLIGATAIIYFIISLASACTILLLASVIDKLFETNVAYYIRQVSPFIFVSFFTIVIENLFQGSNKIYSLAFFRIAPQFLYIAGSLVFIIFVGHFNLTTALLLNLGFAGIVTISMILSLKPRFAQFTKCLNDLWQENKMNGFQVYIGTLVSVAMAQLIGISLGYYANMESVGYYSLALTVTTPLQFIPMVIGTTQFKSFASRSSISPRVIWGAILPTVVTLIVFWLIIERVVGLVYSDRYLTVVPFAKILSIGMVFHGLGGFFNRFLGAHGKGKEMRNAALSMGAIILPGCIVLLPLYGALGGALVMALSSFIFFLTTFRYYKKFGANFSD